MEWYETANALGGTAILGAQVTSASTFVSRIESGLPRRVIVHLKKFGQLTDADLSAVIPRRTLTSLRNVATLSPDQSDRIARTAAVVALAQRVFGDASSARDWLTTPNPALEGEIPLRFLRTGSGADIVESVLARIEYGVYE